MKRKDPFVRHFFLLLFIMLVTAGCAKLAHLEQLLTLKAVSDNRDEQTQFVQAQNQNFDRLLGVVREGTLEDYPDQTSFLVSFGEPVFTRSVQEENVSYEMWLYRNATQYFNTDKVYVYFDDMGALKKWEHIVPERKKE